MGAYAELWLTERAGRRRTESTLREYRRRLRRYVLPRIGGLKLSALTMLDVEDVLDELVDEGLSASTVRGSRIALAAMITDAVRARHLVTNVATLARLPEMEPSARATVPTSAQVLDLLDAAIWFDDMVELLTILATTGVRVGEAMGACWSDLDLAAGVWEVRRTATVNAAGVAVLGTRTKTGESRRVALHADALSALTAQRARIATARLAAGPLWTDHDLVFPSETGTVWDSRNARKRFRDIAAAAMFPGSFHALRHAFATTAIAVLPSDAAVAKVMGHRRKATTVDLYGHLRDTDFRSVTDAVANDLAAAALRTATGGHTGGQIDLLDSELHASPQFTGLESAPGGTRTPNRADRGGERPFPPTQAVDEGRPDEREGTGQSDGLPREQRYGGVALGSTGSLQQRGRPDPARAVHFFTDELTTADGWAQYDQHAWRRDLAGFAEFFWGRIFTEPYSTKQVEDGIGWTLSTGAETLIATQYAPEPLFDDAVQTLALVRSITCPVLLIHGSEDAVSPIERSEIAAEATGGDLLVLEGSGHCPQARDPIRVNRAFVEFVERVTPSGDRAPVRTGAPGPTPRHRPAHPHRRRAARDRDQDQHPTTQNTSLANPSSHLHRAS